MRKFYQIATFVSLYICSAFALQATAPAGYYSSLNGLSGQALKNAVHNLIAPHTVVTYSSLWYYFQSTDCYADNPQRVYDMYSDNQYFFRGSSAVSGMNKEHSFPKSWWGGTEVDAYTDINHLYPSDGPANLAKLNWPLGEVATAEFDNGCTKVGAPVTGQGGGAGTVFEPDDRYKGDFARTYFYMATCYQDYTWKYTYMVNNAGWKTLNDWSIALLLKWMRNDPVSQKETLRNDAVYKIQNNRNPFIDNPTLAEYIWGDKEGQAFFVEGGDDPITGDPELITPTQDTQLDFGEVAIGKSINYTVYVKGKNLTNSLTATLYKSDYKMFSIPVTSIPRSQAVSAQGYPLVITYTPTEQGTHTARLLLSDGGLTGSIGVELKARCVAVPTLSAPVAKPAENIKDSCYTACWYAATDTIDYYLLTREVYNEDGDLVSLDNINVDADQVNYEFNDLKPGQTHYYTLQTYRLGYKSPVSNTIEVAAASVTRGDVNGDGKIDTTDLSALMTIILSNSATAATDTPAADVNADGKVDTTDISALMSIILNG